MVAGLTNAYSGVATLICQSDPFPPFYQARLMLTLEEVSFVKKVAIESNAAMVARKVNDVTPTYIFPLNRGNFGGKKTGRYRHGNKGRGGGCGGGKAVDGGHGENSGRSGGGH